jgi:hypothetical protein
MVGVAVYYAVGRSKCHIGDREERFGALEGGGAVLSDSLIGAGQVAASAVAPEDDLLYAFNSRLDPIDAVTQILHLVDKVAILGGAVSCSVT